MAIRICKLMGWGCGSLLVGWVGVEREGSDAEALELGCEGGGELLGPRV